MNRRIEDSRIGNLAQALEFCRLKYDRRVGRRCPEQRIAERADERGVAQGDFEDSGRGLAGLRGSARQRDTRMCRGELCAGGEIGTQRYAALTVCGDSDSAATGNLSLRMAAR